MPSFEQKLLNNAVGFSIAAKRCLESRTTPSGKIEMLVVPAVVCSAFALELYLKLLIKIETGNCAKGHELEKLFNQLTDKTRTEIERSFFSNEKCEKSQLNSALVEFSRAFCDWRYIHEQGTLSVRIDILNYLIESAQTAVKNLRPKLIFPTSV